MGPQSKREYIEVIVERYRKANRRKKSLLLDELCITCGYHRKYAIEKVNTFNAKIIKPRPGRPRHYDQKQTLDPLKKVWLAANMPASKRLKALLPYWLPFIQNLKPQVSKQLLKMSPATMDRVLKPTRLTYKRKGLSTTRPGTLLRHQIPIKVDQWNEFKPGFIEADTVAHCGTSVDGRYAVTLDCVDIATGWSEQRATWGHDSRAILNQIKHIEKSLPFKLLGFDSDCGGEFINHELMFYLQKRQYPVQFTRSRPYRKDDNAHIEQKNWTHVRQWLGYDRFDNINTVDLLNDLYKNEWRLLFNFFMPSVKIIEKTRIGSKIIKKHDAPKTPYQRLLESDFIDQHIKRKLTKQYKLLNPFILKHQLEKRLLRIKSILRLNAS